MSMPGNLKDVLSAMIFSFSWNVSQLSAKRLFMSEGCSLLALHCLSTELFLTASLGFFTSSLNQRA
ncbi:MAG: hypothetical protein ABIJ56_20565 [Pseudomonadota bacterium]